MFHNKIHITLRGTITYPIPKVLLRRWFFVLKKVGYVRSLEGIQQVYMFQTRTLLARPTAVAGESNEWKQCNNEFLIVFFIRPIDFLIQVSTFFLLLLGVFLHFSRQFVCVFLEHLSKNWSLVSSRKKISWLDWFRIARWAEKTFENNEILVDDMTWFPFFRWLFHDPEKTKGSAS